MCARLRVCALLPPGRAAEVRQRPQGFWRCQCEQNASRPAHSPTRGRRELHGVRGGRTRPGPRLRLRERHLVPAAANCPPPEPVGSCQRRDRLYAYAPSRQHRRQPQVLLLTTRLATRDVASSAAAVTRAPALQAGHQSLGEGGAPLDIRKKKALKNLIKPPSPPTPNSQNVTIPPSSGQKKKRASLLFIQQPLFLSFSIHIATF